MPSLSGLLSPPPLGGGRLAPTLTGRDPYSLVKVLFVSDTMILWYQSISQGVFQKKFLANLGRGENEEKTGRKRGENEYDLTLHSWHPDIVGIHTLGRG